MSKTLASFMEELDAVVARAPNPASLWETIGAALQIWKSGSVPVPEWDPLVNEGLAPIYAAAKKFGPAFREAVDQRVFAS